MRWPWSAKKGGTLDDAGGRDAVNAAWARQRTKAEQRVVEAEVAARRAEWWYRAWYLIDTPARNDLRGHVRNQRIRAHQARARFRAVEASFDLSCARMRA